jgi:dienelactone hydrolase
MLHGDGGLPPQSEWFERFATAMTDHGYIVEIVHYFDRTGTVIASPTDRLAHFREWNLTVRDAINDLARSSDVDPARLGIVGTGLGATLGLTIGVQSADIKAVVEYGGSLPVWAVPTVRRMPSVFIAMTEGEAAGASREAHRISALCDATGASCELQEFPQQGRGARAGPNARPNFRDRAIQFLDQHLKN